jgi:hypothetical protein
LEIGRRVSFGRIGNRGRAIPREFASKEEIWAFVRKGLRRRCSAVRRCGVLYRVLDASPDGRPFVAGVGLDWESRAAERGNAISGGGALDRDKLRRGPGVSYRLIRG